MTRAHEEAGKGLLSTRGPATGLKKGKRRKALGEAVMVGASQEEGKNLDMVSPSLEISAAQLERG